MVIANYMNVKIWNALIHHWSATVLLIAGTELMKWVAVNTTNEIYLVKREDKCKTRLIETEYIPSNIIVF